MKELVEVIAKSLVEHPDEVVVTETENEKNILVELRVAPSDMGKVIGKQGRIAKAIRSVVKAASSKEDKKVVVEILQKDLLSRRGGETPAALHDQERKRTGYGTIFKGRSNFFHTWPERGGQGISDDR